jgi:hypothetical protein
MVASTCPFSILSASFVRALVARVLWKCGQGCERNRRLGAEPWSEPRGPSLQFDTLAVVARFAAS